MARTLQRRFGASGKAFIYKGECLTPCDLCELQRLCELGDLQFFTPDLSYLGNTQVLRGTVTAPERVRSSSSSKMGRDHLPARKQGAQSYVLGTTPWCTGQLWPFMVGHRCLLARGPQTRPNPCAL